MNLDRKKLVKKLKEERFIDARKISEIEKKCRENEETANIENESPEGRNYTVSVAVPGSILDNAQTHELRTYLAGQIARAAAIFEVDEIVVFDEFSKTTEKLYGFTQNSNILMVKILRYLECPQYLRKHMFPLQKDLRYAGLLNPLDCFHHFRVTDLSVPYREGVVLDKSVKAGRGSFVYVGLHKVNQIFFFCVYSFAKEAWSLRQES
ncbi:unnamed protein product [Soboliphyme baturini]|uniref:Uncharacterized protein n=1 Tax=Soboliphyme baturini TaxID=241478 RepID=A0A3P8H412_9BILA|nr:unnamed protein product [Soboliphyme baturini]